MNGYKNKICKYAANKRLISDLKIQIEMRAWKKLFHANGSQKKSRVIKLISEKIDFNIDCKKRQRRTLHND